MWHMTVPLAEKKMRKTARAVSGYVVGIHWAQLRHKKGYANARPAERRLDGCSWKTCHRE